MSNHDQHNDFNALCAGYVLDALDEEDRVHFEELLRNASPEERRIYKDMKLLSEEFPLSLAPVSPSPEVEEHIFDNLDKPNNSRENKAPSILPMWTLKLAAGILLAAMLGLAYYSLDLTNTVEQQQAVITELQSELERQDQLLNVLAAKEVRLVIMGGLEASPDGYGKILWDTENRQAILQLANLPVPPENKDYQLWLIKDNQSPIPAGVFNFDETSPELFFKVESLNESPSANANTFAITLEPKGGLPQPSGEMFLVGNQS